MKKFLYLLPLVVLVVCVQARRRAKQAAPVEQAAAPQKADPFEQFNKMKAEMLAQGGVIIDEKESTQSLRLNGQASQKAVNSPVNTQVQVSQSVNIEELEEIAQK